MVKIILLTPASGFKAAPDAQRSSNMFRKVFPFVALAGLLLAAGCAAVGALPIITQSETKPGLDSAPAANTSAAGSQAPAAGGVVTGQAPAPAGQPAPVSASTRTISVTGSGTASGAPDIAQIFVGVDTQNISVETAISDNQKAMTALLAALKAQGIADADIRTSNYSLSTQNPPNLPLPTTKGVTPGSDVIYSVSNQVHVTVRNVADLGSVLDKVVSAGANNIFGVSFGIADPSKLEDTARASAVKDALARAQALATLEGVTLGDVLSVSESNSSGGPVPMAFGLGGGGTPVEAGSLDVTTTLQVTYAIK